jgi:hypothetical protein
MLVRPVFRDWSVSSMICANHSRRGAGLADGGVAKDRVAKRRSGPLFKYQYGPGPYGFRKLAALALTPNICYLELVPAGFGSRNSHGFAPHLDANSVIRSVTWMAMALVKDDASRANSCRLCDFLSRPVA